MLEIPSVRDMLAQVIGERPPQYLTVNIQSIGSVEGDAQMTSSNNSNNRTLAGDFSHAVLSGNINLGDHVNQSQGSPVEEDLFKKLFAEIEKITDTDEKEMAMSDAKNVQQAVVDKKWGLAKKIFDRLPDAAKIAECGVSIFKMIAAAHGAPLG